MQPVSPSAQLAAGHELDDAQIRLVRDEHLDLGEVDTYSAAWFCCPSLRRKKNRPPASVGTPKRS